MDNMPRSALREFLGSLKQLLTNLLGDEGNIWNTQFQRFLRKEPCWSNGEVTQVLVANPRPDLLELVSTITLPATTAKFVAKEKFVRDTGCKAEVKIS